MGRFSHLWRRNLLHTVYRTNSWLIMLKINTSIHAVGDSKQNCKQNCKFIHSLTYKILALSMSVWLSMHICVTRPQWVQFLTDVVHCSHSGKSLLVMRLINVIWILGRKHYLSYYLKTYFLYMEKTYVYVKLWILWEIYKQFILCHLKSYILYNSSWISYILF